jgi:hypothetical protein
MILSGALFMGKALAHGRRGWKTAPTEMKPASIEVTPPGPPGLL